jgi:hypothetical protein
LLSRFQPTHGYVMCHSTAEASWHWVFDLFSSCDRPTTFTSPIIGKHFISCHETKERALLLRLGTITHSLTRYALVEPLRSYLFGVPRCTCGRNFPIIFSGKTYKLQYHQEGESTDPGVWRGRTDDHHQSLVQLVGHGCISCA